MGLNSITSALNSNVDDSAMGFSAADVAPPRFEVNQATKLQLSDSSMLDLTLPFSHATSLVRRVVSEALLLLRLAVRLWTYLGVGKQHNFQS